MLKSLDPFRFVLIAVAGWMNQRQLQVIDYLREENRVLREQLGGRRLRLSDNQRRRLAAKLGHRGAICLASDVGQSNENHLAQRSEVALNAIARCG